MWSETWSLDTYFYLFENLTGTPLHWNGDSANAIMVAVSNGVFTTPIVSGYDAALIELSQNPVHKAVPGSYNNAGTGALPIKSDPIY